MTHVRARRGSPGTSEFEGDGAAALEHLDDVYGTHLRMDLRSGTVRHSRSGSGGVSFDHLAIDARFTVDADAMQVLVVADVLRGDLEYTRDGITDRVRDGQSVIAAGWNMPFTGSSEGYDVRTTSIPAAALRAAVDDIAPERDWREIRFHSYVPRSPSAGARWRATVDELSQSFPDVGAVVAHGDAVRLLGHTLLQAFPNDVADGIGSWESDRDRRDATPSIVRVAMRVIEERAGEDLSLDELARTCLVSPRSLQYAFRRHLGCTPYAYLRRVRLDLARQALRDLPDASVGDVAARYGFFNPGRFAADYRQLFDENPRQTVLRAGL
jgi:AraC-like DNA-binding protein